MLRDLITCLVQHGASFNQPATLFIGNGQVLKTTPWQHFVSLFSARADDAGWWADAEFAGQTLEAVGEFLEAGTHVTGEDLVSFFPVDFIMSNPEGDLVLGEKASRRWTMGDHHSVKSLSGDSSKLSSP